MPITLINTPTALGAATLAARKQLGLTQPQLALAAGVGVRFIVELEAGKPTLRLETILRVLHALGGTLAVEGLATGPSIVEAQ
jgi:y4mF family transcriptional regulator